MSLYVAIRSGLVGFLVACLIYLLWKISLRIHGFILPEQNSDFFIASFGILLWIIWFSLVQITLLAYDELSGVR